MALCNAHHLYMIHHWRTTLVAPNLVPIYKDEFYPALQLSILETYDYMKPFLETSYIYIFLS